MPRDGAGAYTVPAGTLGVPNTTIESAKYNALIADLEPAVSDSINKSGTKAFAANQPFGGFKGTGLGAGSAATDTPQLGQVQSGIVSHATVVGGTVNAITLTFAPVFTAYTNRMKIRWTSTGVNTVTAPTIAIDAIGSTKIIKKGASVALVAGDTGASGYICEAVYNGTNFILLNPASTSSPDDTAYDATTWNGNTEAPTKNAVRDKIETMVATAATQAEMETATSLLVTVTPGRQHFHPGHSKCWAYVTVSGGTPTLQQSYNITSITDTAVGSLTVTIANDFSSAEWCCVPSIETDVASNADFVHIRSPKAAGSVVLHSSDTAAALEDPDAWNMDGKGDLA